MTEEDLYHAISFATIAHQQQKRWGGTPYIVHPVRVAMRVREHGIKYMIAALLHDVVEDNTTIPVEVVRQKFGDEIADAVTALTRYKDEEYSDYVERCSKNQIATAVKIADLQDNIRSADGQHTKHTDKYKKSLERLSS